MTSFSLTTFDATVEVMIKASDSDDDLAQADRYDRIKHALQMYSADVPNNYTEDVTGDAGKYYKLSTSLTNWSEDWSQVLQVEYPAATIASDEQPQVLESSDWRVYRGGDDAQYIYFINAAPAATEAFRITYTVPYAFSGDPLAADVPGAHFYAICAKAACLCCRAIAAKYSRISDGFLQVDSASHATKAQEFSNRANEYCSLYREELGLPDPDKGNVGTNAAASAMADVDTRPGWPSGRRYVFHRNR